MKYLLLVILLILNFLPLQAMKRKRTENINEVKSCLIVCQSPKLTEYIEQRIIKKSMVVRGTGLNYLDQFQISTLSRVNKQLHTVICKNFSLLWMVIEEEAKKSNETVDWFICRNLQVIKRGRLAQTLERMLQENVFYLYSNLAYGYYTPPRYEGYITRSGRFIHTKKDYIHDVYFCHGWGYDQVIEKSFYFNPNFTYKYYIDKNKTESYFANQSLKAIQENEKTQELFLNRGGSFKKALVPFVIKELTSRPINERAAERIISTLTSVFKNDVTLAKPSAHYYVLEALKCAIQLDKKDIVQFLLRAQNAYQKDLITHQIINKVYKNNYTMLHRLLEKWLICYPQHYPSHALYNLGLLIQKGANPYQKYYNNSISEFFKKEKRINALELIGLFIQYITPKLHRDFNKRDIQAQKEFFEKVGMVLRTYTLFEND